MRMRRSAEDAIWHATTSEERRIVGKMGRRLLFTADGVENIFGDKAAGWQSSNKAPPGGLTLILMGEATTEEEQERKDLVIRGARNIPYVHVLSAGRGVNTADVLRNHRVLVDAAGIRDLEERFTGN
jgi:hypothetical protein